MCHCMTGTRGEGTDLMQDGCLCVSLYDGNTGGGDRRDAGRLSVCVTVGWEHRGRGQT